MEFVTFDLVLRDISRRTFVTSFEVISRRMGMVKKMARIAGVYRAARSKEGRPGAMAGNFLVPNIWGIRDLGNPMDIPEFSALCQEACSWLSGKFPLLEDPTFEQWADGEDASPLVYLINPGIDLDWDDAAELFERPGSFSKDLGLMAFAIYAVFFSQFVAGDGERPAFWDQAAGWFGWGVDLPWWLWLPDGAWRTDNSRFYRLLARAGLPDVADAFRMAWHDTGHFFLDLERDEGGYYPDDTVQEFSAANIERLCDLWKKSEPVYDRGLAACRKAGGRPETYQTIVDLLGGCIVPGDRKATLKELKQAAAGNRRMALAARAGNEHKEDGDGDEDENDDG